MKGLKKFLALAAVPAMLLTLAACKTTPGGYKDVIDRPDIEMPATPPQAVYPEKPATKPSAPAAGVAPSIAAYTASESINPYQITKDEGTVHVSYKDVSNFAYVYAEVKDYSPTYGNVKITLNNSGAERLAIQAVYYEQYELGYTPVTVYLNNLIAGEQYAIFEMKDSLIIDKTFTPVQGEPVKDKTVLGFVIFIDSLPSYAPEKDAAGELDIVSFEFLQDGDPALEDKYVKPVADLTAKTEKNGSVFVPVDKYSADYAKFNVALSGDAGSKAEIAVQYTIPGSTNAISTAKQVELTGTDDVFEYDYQEMMPTEGGDDLTTQYIKNGTVTAVVIKPLENAEITIEDVTFKRTAKEGAYVGDNWSSQSSDVTIPRKANGGNAKLEVYFNESWNNVSVGVKNGAKVTGITFKIYAPDGLTHLGIGITNSSSSHSEGQNAGQFILRGSAQLFNGKASEKAPLSDPTLKGITETLAYDEATKIYTITYDFSKMTENKFEDYTLNSIVFYPHCPNPCDNSSTHKYDGVHKLYFLSIDLATK